MTPLPPYWPGGKLILCITAKVIWLPSGRTSWLGDLIKFAAEAMPWRLIFMLFMHYLPSLIKTLIKFVSIPFSNKLILGRLTMVFLTLFLMLIVILIAAEVFTNALEHLGEKLNISEGVTGSLFAAVGTALPETSVPLLALLACTSDP